METWICDSCGGTIEKSADGWVEWLTVRSESSSPDGRGLRLVHTAPSSPVVSENRCQYDGTSEYRKDKAILKDMPLKHFQGANGLMHLLVFIHTNELPTEEVLEMIKRIHIPGYEHARNHFAQALSAGVFEPNMPENYYLQSDIEATISYIKNLG